MRYGVDPEYDDYTYDVKDSWDEWDDPRDGDPWKDDLSIWYDEPYYWYDDHRAPDDDDLAEEQRRRAYEQEGKSLGDILGEILLLREQGDPGVPSLHDLAAEDNEARRVQDAAERPLPPVPGASLYDLVTR